MMTALKRNCGEVTSLGPAGQVLYFAGRVIRRGILLPLGKNIDYTHTVVLSKAVASTFERRLARASFDAIFAPAARTELAYLETDIPVLYYTDLTARQFRDYARNLRGLTPWAVEQTEHLERRAFRRAQHVVFPSNWAARSALQDYGVPQEKISVIPMGANVEGIPSMEEITSRRSNGVLSKCRLLFVGVDWERKGGNVAFETMIELLNRGLNASLTVVGCRPPKEKVHPKMQVIPFLDKSLPEERSQFNDLLRESDFMVFPTQKDASPIVCAEANAFGLPLIAADVGGLAVRNGENGILLPAAASGHEYSDAIQQLVNDSSRYLALAQSGRAAYDSRLNWDAWGKSINAVLERFTDAKGRTALARP
ncbi:MAG TPA: glycosyltransferase family 4 protein [Ktedonobacteraceae bacterium]|nr:glycosyltransferase family 4 protein [Ktedonobacteraceae bacterium]